jgi:serine/threonine protein phosphatase PrpC
MRFECAERTHVGMVREMNQDALVTLPKEGVFLVADGMGGEMAGDEASAQVVKTVAACVKAFFKTAPHGPSEVESMMRESLLEANHEVFQISVREPAKRGLGSTASMLALHKGVYFTAQVGDSRVYLARSGKVQRVTRDHTLVWDLYEKGMITRDQLETHPERHLLTQCIGNERSPQVETHEGRTQTGDIFLICSDGLTGYASEPRVFEILVDETLSLDERAEHLINAALAAGGGDNVTAVLIRVTHTDESDDWTPEATAETATLEAGRMNDTIIDEVRGQIALRNKQNEKKKKSPILALAVLLLALAAVAAFVLTQNKPSLAPVAVSGDVPQGPVKVTAVDAAGKAAEATLSYIAPGKGELTLPGEGNFVLTLDRENYMPLKTTVEYKKDAQNALAIEGWVQKGRLTLLLPEAPHAASLIVRRDDGAAGAEVIKLGADELAEKREVDAYLEPGISHTIIAKSDGHKDFVRAGTKLNAGGTSQVRIFFAEGAAAP